MIKFKIKKPIVRVGGDSLGIRFSVQERAMYNISEGDVITLIDLDRNIIKTKRPKRK